MTIEETLIKLQEQYSNKVIEELCNMPARTLQPNRSVPKKYIEALEALYNSYYNINKHVTKEAEPVAITESSTLVPVVYNAKGMPCITDNRYPIKLIRRLTIKAGCPINIDDKPTSIPIQYIMDKTQCGFGVKACLNTV